MILMNKLQLESRHQELIDLFDRYLPKYKQMNDEAATKSRNTPTRKFNQLIPINHLALVFQSLLKIVGFSSSSDEMHQVMTICIDLEGQEESSPEIERVSEDRLRLGLETEPFVYAQRLYFGLRKRK